MLSRDLVILLDAQIRAVCQRHKCLSLRVRTSVSQRTTVAPQGSLVARNKLQSELRGLVYHWTSTRFDLGTRAARERDSLLWQRGAPS